MLRNSSGSMRCSRQIDERAAIALGQALGVYSLGGIVATAQNRRVVGGDCH
jgi:hypothetical protein